MNFELNFQIDSILFNDHHKDSTFCAKFRKWLILKKPFENKSIVYETSKMIRLTLQCTFGIEFEFNFKSN